MLTFSLVVYLYLNINSCISVLVVHQAANSKEQTSLERFLLDQCSKSIRFAIKSCWIFQGFVQDRIEGDHSDPVSIFLV